jgi:glycosyltransferase involved in cell wall biosynthesis
MMESIRVSAVIPAYNEGKRIGEVINKVKKYVDEVIVVDDHSSDNTLEVAKQNGAQVISNIKNLGIIESTKIGFKNSIGNIVITLDADGEHNPDEIPNLLYPVISGSADLVLGKREEINRISERFLNWLTNLKLRVEDSGTGFRAVKRDLALKLNLNGKCPCGILVLEADSYGARIVEVPIILKSINKKRKIAWHHFWQFFHILKLMISLNKKQYTDVKKQ